MWKLENARTLIFTPSQIPYKFVAGRKKKLFKKKKVQEGEGKEAEEEKEKKREEGKEETKEKKKSCFSKSIKVRSGFHLGWP